MQYGIVPHYLSNLEYDLPLKDLSGKLVILLCLLSGQRDQTVKALNIKNMLLEKGKCTFFIKRPVKTTKKAVTTIPISRWCKVILGKAGIDIEIIHRT